MNGGDNTQLHDTYIYTYTRARASAPLFNKRTTNLVNKGDTVHLAGVLELPHDPRSEQSGVGEVVVRWIKKKT